MKVFDLIRGVRLLNLFSDQRAQLKPVPSGGRCPCFRGVWLFAGNQIEIVRQTKIGTVAMPFPKNVFHFLQDTE